MMKRNAGAGPATTTTSSSSIRTADWFAWAQLRADGRRPHEWRQLQIERGVGPQAAGSIGVSLGLTVVWAGVTGPWELSPTSRSTGGGLEVTWRQGGMTFSTTGEPSSATSSSGGASGTTTSTSAAENRTLLEGTWALQQVLEAVLVAGSSSSSSTTTRGRYHLVTIQVWSDDGNRWCTALLAAALSLIHAGVPLQGLPVACTAGVMVGSHRPLVDLQRREEQQASFYITCVWLPRPGAAAYSGADHDDDDDDLFMAMNENENDPDDDDDEEEEPESILWCQGHGRVLVPETGDGHEDDPLAQCLGAVRRAGRRLHRQVQKALRPTGR